MRCIVAVVLLAIWSCLCVSVSGLDLDDSFGYAEKVRSLNTKPRHTKGRTAIESHITALLEMGVGASAGGGLAALGFPRTGLNETCNNAVCELMETALSCKGLGFHLSKICAQYILGFLYNCPVFPAPSELFNAPSVCIGELAALLPPSIVGLLPVKSEAPVDADGSTSTAQSSMEHMLKTMGDSEETEGHQVGAGIADSLTFTNIRKYLASDFTENCNRRCFQKYIGQATDFYQTCSVELLPFVNRTNNKNTEYPIPYLLEGFEDFRNQVCAQTQNGTNCFSTVQQFLPSPDKKPDINIFRYDCQWFPENDFNTLVFDGICTQLKDVGCCFGNQVAMYAQSQTNQSANKHHDAIHMFQPCLLKNMAATCSEFLDPTTFCTKGANGNITTIRGSTVMEEAGRRTLPKDKKILNVYDENKVVEFQGVMSLELLWESTDPTAMASLQVEVLNYAYYNSTIANMSPETLLTPANGTLYYPYTWDYLSATSVRIDWQFVLQGRDLAQSEYFYNQLTQEKTCSVGKGDEILKIVYGDAAKCINVSPSATMFNAEPIIPPPKSSASRGATLNVRVPMAAVLLALGLSLSLNMLV